VQGRVDIVLTSDPEVFENLLFPDLSQWYVVFGRDEICLAFTGKSAHADEVSADNWFTLMSAPGVKLGRADENLDVLGYRTLMCWQLAEEFYKSSIVGPLSDRSGSGGIFPSAEQLISSLAAGDVDYAFVYLSSARSRGLRYIRLPSRINLGNRENAGFYSRASVRVPGKERGKFVTVHGTPIEFAAGFLKNSVSKGWPQKFFLFLFSKEAGLVFENNGIAFGKPSCRGPVPEDIRKKCCPKD
jgi:molybdate/tungstate transport system substrate-binding protein